MTHDITKDQYLQDPCGTCATAFWKNAFFKKPHGTKVVHQANMNDITADGMQIERYFRLVHRLKDIAPHSLPANYYFQTVNIQSQLSTVAHFLNNCYDNFFITADQVEKWTKYMVFDNSLWLFVYSLSSSYPVALGIADIDKTIKEGSLEWIQTLPDARGKGIGAALVTELLLRLLPKADFATVSGLADSEFKPEALYRKCGFVGEDIWCVLAPTRNLDCKLA